MTETPKISTTRKLNETVFKFLRKPGLGKTFFLWFLTLSLIPLLLVSIISTFTASGILKQDAISVLNMVSNLKREFINTYFSKMEKDLKMLAQLSTNTEALNNMVDNIKKSELTVTEYLEDFAFSPESMMLEYNFFNFINLYNFKDIILLDLEGNILVSAKDDMLLGANIFKDEQYSKTFFGQTCKKALNTNRPLFSDIEYFAPHSKEPTGFLITKMIYKKTSEDEGKEIGIMAIQIQVEQINKILRQNPGSSQTIETYLIGGNDLKMRSDSKFLKSSSVLNIVVNTEAAERWRNNIKSVGYYVNYRNKNVLGISSTVESLQKLGVEWGLISEIEESEAFSSVGNLMWIVIIIVFGTIFIVSVISIVAARRIVKPILTLSHWAQRVAIGDLYYEKVPAKNNEIEQTADSFSKMVASFQAVTDVCETIAIGDFTKTVDLRSEKDALGKAVNQMRNNLVEVVRQANNISLGDYSSKVVPKNEKDMLGVALERMTRTLHDAAMVAEEVSIGDYSLEVEIKGEKDMLGKALNQMIERLRESNADSQRKIDYLNNIPTPVHVIDSNYNIRFINKAGASLVGQTVDQCIGKKCYALFNTGHCQTEKCRAFRAMNKNTVLTGDTKAKLSNSTIPMRYTSAPLKNSTGNIIGAIEYMVDISDEVRVVELAERISEGDYSVKVEKRSDEDRLSDALNRMTRSLREAVEENRKQNWLRTGQTELNNRMRGELDIPELSQNIITFITTYMDAQVGLLYFLGKADTLKLTASHALGKEKVPVKKFKFGEGLVGQAASENRIIELFDIPPEFIRIRAGMGDIVPRSAIIIPYTYENQVIGVIEIASINEITELHKEFITQSLENIGIAINSAESRRQLTELLEKTQEQAEKLQQQQEELRQSNEELEGQTKALIASETNLQSQQEELRVINEELEERTKALEKQKSDVQHKNLELMMARNEIEKKARDLEEVSKYKSEFLANMSHELRTPLNSILILSQLLSNNADKHLTEKQVEFAKTIHSSGSDLLNLINEILDLSKIEAGMMEIRIERITLDEIVGGLQRVFKPVATNKGVDFIVDIKRNQLPEYIETDSQRSLQIIKNLLSNAFKFTSKGSITLSLSRPPEGTVLTHNSLALDNTIAISVTDTGIGIPEDKQNVIFEAFRQEDGTTSRKYGGTGLGLSISRELAWLLGGEIQMKSKKGKGSIFSLFLPEKLEIPKNGSSVERRKLGRTNPDSTVSTVESAANDSATPLIANEETPPKTRTLTSREPDTVTQQLFTEATAVSDNTDELPDISSPVYIQEIRDDRKLIKPGDKSLLIIEDDPTFSEVLLNLAQSKGFKCLIAEDGETGLHFADFYKPSAIVLDVGLPAMDGWQVLDRLKSNPDTRHIPVHFMSAADNTADAMKRGAIGFLSKPVSGDSLDSAFKKIEKVISKPLKRLLVVDSDEIERNNIIDIIGTSGVSMETVGGGEDALKLLEKGGFDCMVMNPKLNDMSGTELVKRINDNESIIQLPIIIYSEREIPAEEQEIFRRQGQRVIIKNVKTLEGLFAEATLFLHRVEAELPESKKKMLNRMLNKGSIMKDKKILIVDDDMRNVFALTSILEEKGMRTVVGKNGKEGIEKLKEDPEIDLVLMDIMMPILDGYEAMKIIRKDPKYQRLPIIALTAKAMKGDRNKCVAAGASDYLAKPVDAQKLLSLLRVWLYG
jgi:CheY-like chemotaxis protein/methyl-accepting chemotaxis protein